MRRSSGRAIFRGMPGKPAPVPTSYDLAAGSDFGGEGDEGGEGVEEVAGLHLLAAGDAGEVEATVPGFKLAPVDLELADLACGEGEVELVDSLLEGWGQP